MKRLLATVLAAVLAVAALAAAQAIPIPPEQKITAEGVGKLKVGMKHKRARELGLVGPIRQGCELGGPNTRSARLKPPLKGEVNYTQTKPRKVRDITIKGGAFARGVGIGDTIADIKDAYPKAKVDHSTDDTFLITLVKIPKDGGGKLRFGVSTKTDKITLIGVPYIAFCE
jgi:hypothetical protein